MGSCIFVFPQITPLKTLAFSRKTFAFCPKTLYVFLANLDYIPKSIGSPLLMKGLTTLVISMSTNLNVYAYNDILWNCVYSNSLDMTLVLIPAEHLWCDFRCRYLARNASPNTNDLYMWGQSFHTLQNCCNRGGNTIF